ncbi:TonB family protein [Marilutibacter chinensis]|uniref:TonB family protein n=1 Tax=Marilutibacter chinensis TaxID=2912247 RepID=A0ABS9HYX3_9GAMM|nr:TonB family protein [Lysobacter chinensis]MCF7223354.1 TonB family protein [Lysobacter chinensis]
MTSAELLDLLLETTLAGSAAILVVLASRRYLRRMFGPGLAHAAWLLVPAAVLAVLLPAPEAAPLPVATLHAIPAATAAVTVFRPAVSAADGAAAVWGLGVLLATMRLAMQQRGFLRGLGTLQRRLDGSWQASACAGLPAVVGLLRPRIVVPADFDSRYTSTQRALMQLHERTHIRRGDLHVNAVVALLRCLFWFNPLVHAAARRFRHDQELACDAAVVARYPHRRRAYGEAMLHTQLAAQPLPLGCHWGFSHPLRERIEMLKLTPKSGPRIAAGIVVITALAVATGAAAWAAQPGRAALQDSGSIAAKDGNAVDGHVVGLSVRIDDSRPMASSGRFTPGREQVFDYDHEGQRWEVALTITPADAGTYTVATRILRDGQLQAAPNLVVREGEDAGITVGERTDDRLVKGLELGLVVRRADAQAVDDTRIQNPPAYPAAAAAGGVGGSVVLLVDVDAAGKPTLVQVERSEPAGVFDAASIEAAYKWRFDPEIRNGEAVPSRLRVPVRFDPPVADGTPADGPAPG